MTVYVDVEPALIGWLASHLSVRCVTELPADLNGALPVVQVARLGGVDTVPGLDDATVDLDCFDLTRAAARTLAYRVWHALRADLPGTVVTGGVVSAVRTLVAPAWRPWDNTSVRRFGLTAQVTVHTQQ